MSNNNFRISLNQMLDEILEEGVNKHLEDLEKEEAKQYTIYKNPNSSKEDKKKALDNVRKLGTQIQHIVKYGEIHPKHPKPSAASKLASKITRAIKKVGEKWTTRSGNKAVKNKDGTITYTKK